MHQIAPFADNSQQTDAVLAHLEKMLDELIGCQREEQECILNRDVVRLPVVCEKISALSLQLERHQLNLKTFLMARPLPDGQEKLRVECVRKFKRMQELARQNHILLENSLRFLQQIMSEFLGSKRSNGTYNPAGLVNAGVGGGLLMDLKA
jgi:hypothetical protein